MDRVIISPTNPSLSSFKAHLRITSNDLDGELRGNLLAAIRAAEATIGQVITPSTYVKTIPFHSAISLKGPVMEVLEVMVDDSPVTGWRLRGSILTLPSGTGGDTVTVRWKAGMPSLPPDIEKAVLLKATRLFQNPGDSVDTLTTASDNLLRPYRTWGLDPDEED